ncbi:MAG TPA: TonB family protein [Polyangia bacterium]
MERTEIRRGRRGNFVGLLVTIALHGGVLAAIALAHGQEQPPLIVQHDFVSAEMVKLGKPRDKFWLPRITQPPPPKAPPDTLKVSEDPNAKAAPKEAPKPEDKNIKKDLKNALDRARKLAELAVPEESDEGSLTGSNLGTSNQAVGDQYLAAIKGLLIQNYNLPAGMGPEQISTPPEIRFRFSDDGTISDVKLTKSSGNPLIDDACIDAAKLARKVPPPPSTFHKRGISVACEK